MRLENVPLDVAADFVEPLLQRHVEQFFKEQRALNGSNDVRLSSPEYQGNMLRAAWTAGVLLEPKQDVGAMRAAQVRWLAQKVDTLLGEALSIPPE